jgi:hypothetical protein
MHRIEKCSCSRRGRLYFLDFSFGASDDHDDQDQCHPDPVHNREDFVPMLSMRTSVHGAAVLSNIFVPCEQFHVPQTSVISFSNVRGVLPTCSPSRGSGRRHDGICGSYPYYIMKASA